MKPCCWCTAVAYVKYERASSAAAAMESLHEAILEDGRTKLKVMLAEEPHATCALFTLPTVVPFLCPVKAVPALALNTIM